MSVEKIYPHRLSYQIAALLLVIIITAFFAFGWITARKQTESLQNIMTESAVKMTKGLADSCVRYFLIWDYAGLDELLKKFIFMSGAVQIQVFREDGKVLSEIIKDSSLSQNIESSLKKDAKVLGGAEEEISIQDDFMTISQPVISSGVLGWTRITFDLHYIKKMRREIWLHTGLAALFWTLLSVTIFMIIFKRLAGVIQQLSDFSRRLSNLNGEVIEVKHSSYEIQQLCQSLNYASTDIFNKENELKSYRDNLENLVTIRTVELEREIAERKKTEKEKEMLIQELQTAIEEIKTLKGIIPICMHCKGIRDDKGSWNKLEKFITEHSEAQFSHGICEECLEKYYPEEADIE